MRRSLALLAVFLLVLGVSAAAMAGGGSAVSDGYRILLPAAEAGAAGLSVRRVGPGGRVSAQVSAAQLAALGRMGVAYELIPMRTVQTDGVTQVQAARPSAARVTPTTQVPFGIKMIYGESALRTTGIAGGAGVKVAVLDTGSSAHPDFIRRDGAKVIAECVDFSSTKADIIPGQCADGHGHGTHVTGTIAAAGGADGKGIFGVAPGVSILSYKVLTNRGTGFADDIARAIRYAADHGANIISMSLGSATPSSLELDAIRYAVGKGALVIAAAGNSGPSPDMIGYPAAYPEVVAVAALNADEVVSYFSSRGITDHRNDTVVARELEVSGPGRDVISTYYSGGYATMSGTSMATPHLAGLAAKMWKGNATDTRAWLRSAATRHDILSAEMVNNAGPGYDIASGYGLPQVRTTRLPVWSN